MHRPISIALLVLPGDQVATGEATHADSLRVSGYALTRIGVAADLAVVGLVFVRKKIPWWDVTSDRYLGPTFGAPPECDGPTPGSPGPATLKRLWVPAIPG